MSFDRVSYGDTRVYINDVLLKGISSCEINTTREVENLRSINHHETTDRIIKSDQKPEATLSWILGEDSSDPFFSFQTSGILSVESFNIKKKDIVGVEEVKSGFLTSYSVNAAVGDLITAEAKYEGIDFSFTEAGKLTLGVQTSDSYKSFLPSKIQLSATFQEGDIFTFPIQSFQINVPVPRQSLKRLGEQSPKYRLPTLPTEATVSFSAIKNDITGLDFSRIVLEKGNFEFLLATCDDVNKSYTLSGCSLLGISESIDLEGNAAIDFNYVASIKNDTFNYATSILSVDGLLDLDGVQLLSSDPFVLMPYVDPVDDEDPPVLVDLETHIVSGIDSRLVGKNPTTDKSVFTVQDFVTPAYTRNTSCWAYDLTNQLTANSPWNSDWYHRKVGILISPIHILFNVHYWIANGSTISFVKADNTVVNRTMTNSIFHPDYVPFYPDIAIGILDSAVPNDVEFVKVLPDNWASYFNGSVAGKKLPLLYLDQEEKAMVADLQSITSTEVLLDQPTDSTRNSFYEEVIGGDSSNGVYFVINNELVLLTTFTFGYSDPKGTSATAHKTAINTMMTTLGGGYQLTEIDLSGFITY